MPWENVFPGRHAPEIFDSLMAMEQDCYLCSKAIDVDHATVSIPRLGLRVHLSCYEQDVAAGRSLIHHRRREGESP